MLTLLLQVPQCCMRLLGRCKSRLCICSLLSQALYLLLQYQGPMRTSTVSQQNYYKKTAMIVQQVLQCSMCLLNAIRADLVCSLRGQGSISAPASTKGGSLQDQQRHNKEIITLSCTPQLDTT